MFSSVFSMNAASRPVGEGCYFQFTGEETTAQGGERASPSPQELQRAQDKAGGTCNFIIGNVGFQSEALLSSHCKRHLRLAFVSLGCPQQMTAPWRPESHRNLSPHSGLEVQSQGWQGHAYSEGAREGPFLSRSSVCLVSLACGSIAPIPCHFPVRLHMVLSLCVSVRFASSYKDTSHRIWGSSSTRMTSFDLMTSTKTLFSNKVTSTDIGVRSWTLWGRRNSPHLTH